MINWLIYTCFKFFLIRKSKFSPLFSVTEKRLQCPTANIRAAECYFKKMKQASFALVAVNDANQVAAGSVVGRLGMVGKRAREARAAMGRAGEEL